MERSAPPRPERGRRVGCRRFEPRSRRWGMTSEFMTPALAGAGRSTSSAAPPGRRRIAHGRFPIGTVAYYGPDDKTTTKIAAGVILREGGEVILERFVGTDVVRDAKVAERIKQFFAKHGVKSVVVTDGNLGCPHEEGLDFPRGRDCPFCPFWAGK